MNDILKNIIYGYIVGDSYGLGLLKCDKFGDKQELQENNELNISKGNYSSMSVFMLSVLDSLIKIKDVDLSDILNKMCASLIVGKYTSDRKIYDLDNNTLNILKHYSKKNNLDIEYDELDESSYSISRLLPIILFNYYKEDNFNKLESVISLTNINDTVLLGIYIYYKYIFNLLDGYDKYKALYKISIPDYFDKNVILKYKNLLKGNIYYKEIRKDDNIVNVLNVVFYVILHSYNFNDIFMMLDNIGGNTNIYGALICSVGGLLYSIDGINSKIIKDIKNKNEINKLIRRFERILK